MLDNNPFISLRAGLAAAAEDEEFLIYDKAIRDLDAELIEALLVRDSLADSEHRDRYSAQRALAAVVRFLQAHPRWRAASIPLVQLQSALRDLDNGHVAPVLRPQDTTGRPVSWSDTTLKGYAAGIMGGLMKHATMPVAQAADWVSKRLQKAGHDVAAGTVIDWRKNALNHKRNPDLHRAYGVVIGQPDWSAPLQCAELLIGRLIELHPQKGG
jgi:hypothetical protein